MIKKYYFFLISILSCNVYSQISYENGYYIDNTNQKINCLIKNIDWKNNPTEFKYKLLENDKPKSKTIDSVKEFGIDNLSKYIRSVVDIDRSTENIDNVSFEKKPIFKKEVLFLRVLIEGKANIYEYIDGNLKKYFYNKDNNKIEQLIFKSYYLTNNQIRKNYEFRQQLQTLDDSKCLIFINNSVKSLEYNKKELISFFVEYNKCNDIVYKTFDKKRKSDLFNLNIRPGLNNSTLLIYNNEWHSRYTTDFGNELGFRFGIEAEFILSFNKNKWAIIIEPTYQYFKSEIEKPTISVKVDYKSIELPIGIRHYFFLNKNSKIFINSSMIFNFSSNSTINFDDGESLEIDSKINFAFGIGYKYNKRYSLELRYHTNRDILTNYLSTYWNSKYKTASIIFGYSLF